MPQPQQKVVKNIQPRQRRRPPALSPEGRINRIIDAAYDLAEKQILEGTASSQVISKFLDLGTQKTKLEQEKLRHENELLHAKTEALKTAQRSEEFYKEVLKAFRSYSGQSTADEDEDYGDY